MLVIDDNLVRIMHHVLVEDCPHCQHEEEEKSFWKPEYVILVEAVLLYCAYCLYTIEELFLSSFSTRMMFMIDNRLDSEYMENIGNP